MSLPLDSQVYTEFSGLSALRAAGREKSPEAIRAVAEQFESLFVQMMVKEMRATLPDDGLFSNDQTRFYESMYDKQLSMELSKGEGIGLADVIARQLGAADEGGFKDAKRSEQVFPAFSGSPAVPPPVSGRISVQATAPVNRGYWRPDSPAQFVSELKPHAERIARRLNVPAEALLAQTALETGWGQRVMSDERGSSFNLFGIKADRDWSGPTVRVSTVEFEQGVAVRKQANFRAYGSLSESFEDYAAFLQGHARYREALSSGAETQDFVKALGRSGYATDPEYASKINGIIGSERFREALGPVKSADTVTINRVAETGS